MPWDRFINCTQFRTRFHLLSKAPQHLLSFKTNHNQPTRHCQPQLPHQLYHITQHTNTNLRFHALPIQESKQNAHKTHKPMPHNPKPPNPYSHPATARARVCAFVCVFLWDRVFVCVCARVFLWDRVCVCVCVCVCVWVLNPCAHGHGWEHLSRQCRHKRHGLYPYSYSDSFSSSQQSPTITPFTQIEP